LRLLDDRSLNGVFVDGQRVDWSTLADGDQIVIGAHHLHFIVVPVRSSIVGDRREAAELARH
jgi:pSer/pThr/pTyr-binding forkhead associated (FHA) protein